MNPEEHASCFSVWLQAGSSRVRSTGNRILYIPSCFCFAATSRNSKRRHSFVPSKAWLSAATRVCAFPQNIPYARRTYFINIYRPSSRASHRQRRPCRFTSSSFSIAGFSQLCPARYHRPHDPSDLAPALALLDFS